MDKVHRSADTLQSVHGLLPEYAVRCWALLPAACQTRSLQEPVETNILAEHSNAVSSCGRLALII